MHARTDTQVLDKDINGPLGIYRKTNESLETHLIAEFNNAVPACKWIYSTCNIFI